MGNSLRNLRKARNWTHDQAAAAMGLSRGQFIKLERGERGLTERTITLAVKAFGVPPSEVLGDDSIEAQALPIEAPNARLEPEGGDVRVSSLRGARNVPVYGTGSGGSGGDFRLNGQLIDHAPRPPGIENRSDVYVVYVIGNSISPAYEDGSPIYVDPHRRPQPRDYVVVELKGTEEGEPGDAYVKRLVKRTPTKLVLEQFEPKKQIEFDEADVLRVHRVIPWLELIGL